MYVHLVKESIFLNAQEKQAILSESLAAYNQQMAQQNNIFDIAKDPNASGGEGSAKGSQKGSQKGSVRSKQSQE